MNFVRDFAVELRGTDLSSVSGAAIAQDCPKACNLLYPELRYTLDARDNFIEPTQGYYGSVGLQQALKLNATSFSYFRINPGCAPLLQVRRARPARRVRRSLHRDGQRGESVHAAVLPV